MADDTSDKRYPFERVHDVENMLLAMRQGVQEALLRHKQAGQSVATWHEGKVVWVAPEDIPIDDLGSP